MQRNWMAMRRRRAKELGKSLEKVARDAGLTRAYLYELAMGRTEAPNIRTLVHVARALELSPISVLRHYVDFHASPRRAGPKMMAPRIPSSRAEGLANAEDIIVFNSDVTVPDHSAINAGEAFRKVWEVQNQGNVPWLKRRLIRADQHYAISRKAVDGRLEGHHSTSSDLPGRGHPDSGCHARRMLSVASRLRSPLRELLDCVDLAFLRRFAPSNLRSSKSAFAAGTSSRPSGATAGPGQRHVRPDVDGVIRAVDCKQIPSGQYQAILIDEGHDFKPEWLKLVTQMVDPSTNSLLLLYDDGIPIVKPISHGRDGAPPLVIRLPSLRDEVEHIAELLAEEHHGGGRAWSDMAILCRDCAVMDAWAQALSRVGGVVAASLGSEQNPSAT